MSTSVIVARFKPSGILTDATTVTLSDRTGTYGVKRSDNDALVVADDTAMTHESTGVYSHTFTDPADGLTYEYVVEFVWGGETYWISGTKEGGTDGSENLYDLIDQIQPHVGDAPEYFVKQMLRSVARDFCRKTHVWVEQLTTIPSVASQEDYTLTSSYDAKILRVLEVKLETVDHNFSMDEEGTLTMDPATGSTGDDIDVKVVLLPDEDCSGFHAWLIDRWGDAIAAGTIFWLKAMPNQAWTDYEGAGFWQEQYKAGVAWAKGEEMTQRHRGENVVVIPEYK